MLLSVAPQRGGRGVGAVWRQVSLLLSALGRGQGREVPPHQPRHRPQGGVLLSSAVLLSTTLLLPQYHIKYVARAFFFLHTINAYEEAEHVVVDICGYDR